MRTQTTDNLKSLIIKIWAHRPSIKVTEPRFIVIKAIIIITAIPQFLDKRLLVCLSVFSFVSLCLFVVIKPENPYFASHLGLEVKPLGVYPLGQRISSCRPTKLHLHPETLYLPTEVDTLQVDGLARIRVPGLTQALYMRIFNHWIASRNSPHLIPLSTNTQGSLVP